MDYIIQIYSGITRGRVRNGESWKRVEYLEPRILERNLHETACRQMQIN